MKKEHNVGCQRNNRQCYPRDGVDEVLWILCLDSPEIHQFGRGKEREDIVQRVCVVNDPMVSQVNNGLPRIRRQDPLAELKPRLAVVNHPMLV